MLIIAVTPILSLKSPYSKDDNAIIQLTGDNGDLVECFVTQKEANFLKGGRGPCDMDGTMVFSIIIHPANSYFITSFIRGDGAN